MKVTIIHYIAIIALCLGVVSCQKDNIPYKVRRTNLYKEVMSYYDIKDTNAKKREAALFLFKYMDEKHSEYDSSIDSLLFMVQDSIQKHEKRPSKKEIVALISQLYDSEKSNLITEQDLYAISDKSLIEHINLSYYNWNKMSKLSQASFDDYCNYILPYREQNEPLHEIPSSFLNEQFSWFQDSLQHSDSIIRTIDNFIKIAAIKMEYPLGKTLHYNYSALQTYKIKVVPRCDDIANFLALTLRSLGVPATTDFVEQWGNHPYVGHRWLAVKWQGKWYPFDTTNRGYLGDLYKKECIAKVWRNTYTTNTSTRNNSIDVTNQYVTTYDIKIPKNLLKKTTNTAIAIFNKKTGFNIIEPGIETDDHIVFKDLGTHIFYFVGNKKLGGFHVDSPAYFLDQTGNAIPLIANQDSLQVLTLHRKYPRCFVRNPKKMFWATSLSGSVITASNDGFSTEDTLAVLRNYNSYKEEKFAVNTSKQYSAVRYICSGTNMIAGLHFWENNKKLSGDLLGNYGKKNEIEKVFDDDILSWIYVGWKTKEIYFGLNFEEPHSIDSITVLARNDGNHIIIGQEYELMVWINGWKSFGRQKAKEQKLTFENIPTGGLYWLKNLTTGVEELPFMITDEGQQYWPSKAGV